MMKPWENFHEAVERAYEALPDHPPMVVLNWIEGLRIESGRLRTWERKGSPGLSTAEVIELSERAR